MPLTLRSRFEQLSCVALLSWLPASAALSTEPHFSREIHPILSDVCFHCHGPDEASREADLRLDTRAGLYGDEDFPGPVLPGDVDGSLLMQRVLSDDPDQRMPPPDSKLSLTDAQIAQLRAWISAGAPWAQHWSFAPPTRPDLPTVADSAWPENEIDAFVLARLERAGLTPNPPASKERLLRRVTLDLTGLPPTVAELDQFLADDSPDAYERVVQRLLSSPRYGERMIWDWLEAARYADTNGFQGDPLRTMWPWRDWVLEAINSNLPYDQFTIEQLAGDLLPEATRDQIIATGFNRNHMHNGEGGRIAEETRVENVFDRLETTATLWLGLTMNCCRCHDHKFDPISQQEYYQFYAFFNNTSEDGRIPRKTNVDPVTAVPSPEQERKQRELAQKIDALVEKISAAESADLGAGPPPETWKAVLAQPPRDRSAGDLQKMVDHWRQSAPRYAAHLADLKAAQEAQASLEAEIPTTMVMDSRASPRSTFVLDRGLYNKPLDQVGAAVPQALPALPEEVDADRLALARWLVRDDHPLTARVTVNRFWQMLFGVGLVATPDDFGVQGERPSHPDLLDWLAVDFVDNRWDTKALIKKMVMSSTYRQSARIDDQAAAKDPENRLLSRAPRFRMPSWMIRDAALAVSGLLVEQRGGPPVKPYQPPGIWQEASFGKIRYEQDHGEQLYRRSLYTFWRRIVGPTMFFDVARRQTCTVKRALTNTPLHALVVFNDVTYVEAARVLAEQLLNAPDDDRRKIVTAFRMITSRTPTVEEVDLLEERWRQLTGHYGRVPDEAQRFLATGEAPRDESLDPARHAALSGLCLMLFNLDEALTK